jgi:quercetin dioxygenase-like cupin family protein
VGYVVYAAGQEIARHMHLPVERTIVGTAEVLVVQQGRCEVDVYAEDRRLVDTRELRQGDVLIALAGGHAFRVLEDTVLLEVKQGPFVGDAASKERF